MRVVVLLATVVAAVAALTAEMPEPSQMVFTLDEEEFEDYLDAWLAKEEATWLNATGSAAPHVGCTFRVNGDLGQPQPVYLLGNNFLRPTGNTGQIRINVNQQVRIGCPGTGITIRHPNIQANVQHATATCVNNNLVSGAGWLRGNSAFGGLTCSAHAVYNAQATGARCFNNIGIVIRVGFIVDNVFRTSYHSCFDQTRLEVLYVWYDQDTTNALPQTGVGRPDVQGDVGWLAGGFFPGVNINNLYTQVTQKQVIAGIVGQAQANQYVTNQQYLSRGHYAAKSDFVFATAQRATFYFINAAPQWQPFNGGNWNTLEQRLRERIAQAGYNTVIYTGTYGVTQLRDANGRLQPIYLHRNNQVPVPLYFYKVAYDAGRRLGTAFVSINNPYYTPAEVRNLQFCTDRCLNNNRFNWLNNYWDPHRIDIGYSFCCSIDEFRTFITHFPNLNVIDLLT